MQKVKNDIQLGATLRSLRKSCNLTQDAVATKLQLKGISISRSAYAQIECNISNIKITELIALSQIFGVSLDEIFKDCIEEFNKQFN